MQNPAIIPAGNWIGEYMGVPMSRRRFQNPTPRLRRGRWEILVREDIQGLDGCMVRRQKRLFLGTTREIPTQRIARRIAEPILAQINSTVSRPKLVSRFADFARRWSETVLTEMKPSSQVSIRSVVRHHLVPAFGNHLFYEFTPEMVQVFIAQKRREVSPKTVWNIVMVLRSIWNTALQWRYASDDIFAGVRMRTAPRTEARCFTGEDVRRILEAAEEPYRTFYWLAAETGMRAGELCGLRWQDFDPEAGILRVWQSAWGGKIGSPKTPGSVRTFAVSEILSQALERLQIGRAHV